MLGRPPTDIIGSTFDFVMVKARRGTDTNKHPLVLCLCKACGQDFTVRIDVLRRGDQKSCGCMQHKLKSKSMQGNKLRLTHGLSHRPEYFVWKALVARCTNPKDARWKQYGGNNPPVKVCRRWRKLENFIADMGPRPSSNHSISRFGDVGNYEPGNCAWHTWKQQAEEAKKKRLRKGNQ